MNDSVIDYSFRDGVAYVTIDDGKVNAVSLSLIAEFEAMLVQASRDEAILVIRGRPGIFSAGFDLGYLMQGPEHGRELTAAGARLAAKLMAHDEPVVIACTGHAYPMGAFLLMSADHVIGVEGDFRLGLNEVAIGLTVPQFAVELARYRLAPNFFRRTVTQGELFSPQLAVEAGLLDEVVAPSELEPALASRVEALLKVDRQAFRNTKRRAHGDFHRRFGAVLAAEFEAA